MLVSSHGGRSVCVSVKAAPGHAPHDRNEIKIFLTKLVKKPPPCLGSSTFGVDSLQPQNDVRSLVFGLSRRLAR